MCARLLLSRGIGLGTLPPNILTKPFGPDLFFLRKRVSLVIYRSKKKNVFIEHWLEHLFSIFQLFNCA
jgi:hypothetical protein